MEAHTRRVVAAAVRRPFCVAALLWVSMGAQFRSANFIVETPDPHFSQQVAQTAEKCRHDLAIAWLGEAMPNWAQPCVMEVRAGRDLGAGGQTTFVFDQGEVFGWRMSIQGSPERILDSVLPHEVTHMVFASHFREPLPRWADEGGATSVEHASEKNKQRQMLDQCLRSRPSRGIPFNQMFAMTEYPKDILPLYAQGYSLVEYLIQIGGRRKFVEFLDDGLKKDDWPGVIEKHYGIQDLSKLQNTWLTWVAQGYPPVTPRDTQPAAPEVMLASHQAKPKPEPNLIYHVGDGQSGRSTDVLAGTSGRLVPVAPPPSALSAAAMASSQRNAQPLPISPSRATAASVASVPMQPAKILPTSGWQRIGQPASATAVAATAPPSEDPLRAQVTHPMPIESSRQTVLR